MAARCPGAAWCRRFLERAVSVEQAVGGDRVEQAAVGDAGRGDHAVGGRSTARAVGAFDADCGVCGDRDAGAAGGGQDALVGRIVDESSADLVETRRDAKLARAAATDPKLAERGSAGSAVV